MAFEESHIDPSTIRNRLLRALPPNALEALLPHFEQVDLPLGATLIGQNQPITTAYFPENSYASLLATLEDRDVVEVGMIGHEGVVGLPLVFDTDRAPVEAMVQAAGSALAISAGAFRALVEEIPSFRKIMLRYAMAFHMQVTMTAACNSRHHVEQRLARWLLMAHDRSQGDTFPMTHEFLSMMLGVRRAGVTVAAGMLQKAGLINYAGGRITIADRLGLENAACECHAIVQKEFIKLTGIASGAWDLVPFRTAPNS